MYDDRGVPISEVLIRIIALFNSKFKRRRRRRSKVIVFVKSDPQKSDQEEMLLCFSKRTRLFRRYILGTALRTFSVRTVGFAVTADISSKCGRIGIYCLRLIPLIGCRVDGFDRISRTRHSSSLTLRLHLLDRPSWLWMPFRSRSYFTFKLRDILEPIRR